MEPLIAFALGVAAATLPADLSVSRSAARRVAPWAVPAGVLLAMASLVSVVGAGALRGRLPHGIVDIV